MPDSISPIKNCEIIQQQTASGLSEDKPVNSIMIDINTSGTEKKYCTKDDLKKLFEDKLGINDDKNLNLCLVAFTDYENIQDLRGLDDNEIENIVAEIAKDYKTAINTRWSLEEIASRQQNVDKKGLSERLADFYPDKNMSLKEKIEKYFHDYFVDDLVKKGNTHDQIVTLQLQTFGRMLINSSEEEKVAFKEVVKNLLVENMPAGLKETLESIDSEDDKKSFANSFVTGDIIEVSKYKDYYENKVTDDQLQDIVAIITSYQDSEHIETNHKDFNETITEFLNEHKEAIDIIRKKNKEELTDEEQQLLDELKRLKAISSGEMVGTANNTVIAGDDRTNLLSLMNEDNYNHGEDYYRDVIEGIKYYVDEHGDELNITIDEFNVILDKATNNNYSILSGDINAPISPPDSSSPRETNINNGGLGFTIGDKPNVNPDPTVYYPQEDSLPIIVVPNSKTANDVGDKNYKRELLNSDNPEELNNYIKKVGLIGFIEFCMKNAKKGSNAFNMAIKYFKNMSSAMKTVVISFMQDTSSIIELAKTMSLEELKQIKRGPNIYATKMLEMFKEMKEEQLY